MSARAPPGSSELVERLDRILPQTQCGQCGYDGCRPYAEAMAAGEAGIDHCPPGGDAGVRALAHVLGVPALPYDHSRGEQPPPLVARVVEADCIGCTKCIQACPVDAIIGASKHMHVVIETLCTGCALCVAPCPVDCIVMVPATAPTSLIESLADGESVGVNGEFERRSREPENARRHASRRAGE